jgi:hypothetical protein
MSWVGSNNAETLEQGLLIDFNAEIIKMWLQNISFMTRTHDLYALQVLSLLPQSRVLLEKLIIDQIIEKFSHFMAIVGSLPCSQQPITSLSYLYLVQETHTHARARTHTHTASLWSTLILYPLPLHRPSNWFFILYISTIIFLPCVLYVRPF